MKALVLWQTVRKEEQIGPHFEIYLIENPTQEEITVLRDANNAMVNSSTQNESSLKLFDAFNEEQKSLSSDKKWLGKWVDDRLYISVSTPIEKQIDLIVFSGIFYK